MEKYKELFAQYDEYSTQKNYRKPFFPSFYFYICHVARIVLYSYKQAKNNDYGDIKWVNSSLDVLKSIEKTGINVHVSGMNNLRKVEGPVVFVSNHMSVLETFLFPSFIHQVKKIVYVMKVELTTFPFFGKVATARNPIVVGRKNPKEDLITVLEDGSSRIKNGLSVIIFPQRTRSKKFDPSLFNSLGVKLAKRNNVPVIPIAIVTDAWGNGKLIKEFGKIDPTKEVKMAFGEPMEIIGNGNEQHEKSVYFIKSKLTEWGRTDLLINNP
ncbi:MAG: 1-acyl-sn-glycerol-3-phosphate acyltransferase [Ignavibacteria bacterium]|nr:1-acyl-sn-glycerol-3-phosphate acyltransferase [Ignavibacteria bacterium]